MLNVLHVQLDFEDDLDKEGEEADEEYLDAKDTLMEYPKAIVVSA